MNMLNISFKMIVAMDAKQLIGQNNTLPWHLPLDLKLFKAKTLHQNILMGYNTFESIIQRSGKPLPKRTHWVLTRKNINDLPVYPDVHYINHIDDCLAALENDDTAVLTNRIIWIIGGAQLYNQLKNHPNLIELHITEIQKIYEGDAYFNLSFEDLKNWQLLEDMTLSAAYQNHQDDNSTSTSSTSAIILNDDEANARVKIYKKI